MLSEFPEARRELIERPSPELFAAAADEVVRMASSAEVVHGPQRDPPLILRRRRRREGMLLAMVGERYLLDFGEGLVIHVPTLRGPLLGLVDGAASR